jgi:hypothetical protein
MYFVLQYEAKTKTVEIVLRSGGMRENDGGGEYN